MEKKYFETSVIPKLSENIADLSDMIDALTKEYAVLKSKVNNMERQEKAEQIRKMKYTW